MPSYKPPTLPSATRRKALAGLAAAHATAGRAPSLILPRLYLANWTVAADEALLAELGVTHVVSVLEFPPEYAAGLGIRTLHVRVEDTFRTDILRHLDETTEFIRAALSENETNIVLVHCLMGVSRSATVVCAYLIATMSMTAPEAIDFVAKRRVIASPNVGFRRQLETYASRFTTQKAKTQSTVDVLMGKMKTLRVHKETEVREELLLPTAAEEPVPIAA